MYEKWSFLYPHSIQKLIEVTAATIVLLFSVALSCLVIALLLLFWWGALFVHKELGHLLLAVFATLQAYLYLGKLMLFRVTEDLKWFLEAIHTFRRPR